MPKGAAYDLMTVDLAVTATVEEEFLFTTENMGDALA